VILISAFEHVDRFLHNFVWSLRSGGLNMLVLFTFVQSVIGWRERVC